MRLLRTLIFAFSIYFAIGQDIELNLAIEAPTLAKVGDQADLKCTLGNGNMIQGEVCHWTTPDNRNLKADLKTGKVTDTDSHQEVAGFEAFGDNYNCGLMISALSLDDMGQWKCRINEQAQGQTPFHIGSFNVLESGYVKDVRLPTHISPNAYEVQMIPILEEGNFTTLGAMTLHFEYKADNLNGDNSLKKKIFLHSNEIQIDEASVEVKTITNVANSVVGHEYDREREFYVIHLKDDLIGDVFTNEYDLKLDFVAVLNDKLRGFYRSSYSDPDGTKKYLGVSQFEAIDARRAFPCLDEPAMKAQFTARLGRPKHMKGWSNMPKVAEDEPVMGLNDYVIDTYESSPRMSTYLLAFIVAEFEAEESPLNSDYTVIHMKNKADQTALALDSGPRIVNYYDQYFGIPYPLPKMDMGAVPDFSAGAMENWGLITYRETTLLFKEGFSSRQDRERVIEVVAHELAHQWFGNLVTMEWWTDLWLNEGFATYVENIGKDFYDPDLRSVDIAILEDQIDVFGMDALESSYAISQTVNNPYYDLVFGRISYGKGNCLIRMIEHFITQESFHKGVNAYLSDLSLQNAERTDLWDALNTAAHNDGNLDSNIDIATVMETWTTQPGYPVLTMVSRDAPGQMRFEQKRFYLNPNVSSSALWHVPITVGYPGDLDDLKAEQWMTEREGTINVVSDVFIINVQAGSYYRVNYDANHWNALSRIMQTNSSLIHFLNRAALVDDSLNLARAGQLDYEIALEFTRPMKSEKEYIALEAGLVNLEYLDVMLRESTVNNYKSLQGYMSKLLEPHYNELGFQVADATKYHDLLRQIAVIDWMCLYGNADCVKNSKDEFAAWMNEADPDSVNPINPDLKQSVYEVAIREGGKAEFDFLYERLPGVTVDQEVTKIIYGLGSTLDPQLIERLLNETITTNGYIRSQNAIYVYRGVGKTAIGRTKQFQWLVNGYDTIKAFFGPNFASTVGEIVDPYAAGANTQAELDALTTFGNEHASDLGNTISTVEQGKDTIKINMLWMSANYETVSAWLQINSPTSETTTEGGTTDESSAAGSQISAYFFIAVIFAVLM